MGAVIGKFISILVSYLLLESRQPDWHSIPEYNITWKTCSRGSCDVCQLIISEKNSILNLQSVTFNPKLFHMLAVEEKSFFFLLGTMFMKFLFYLVITPDPFLSNTNRNFVFLFRWFCILSQGQKGHKEKEDIWIPSIFRTTLFAVVHQRSL